MREWYISKFLPPQSWGPLTKIPDLYLPTINFHVKNTEKNTGNFVLARMWPPCNLSSREKSIWLSLTLLFRYLDAMVSGFCWRCIYIIGSRNVPIKRWFCVFKCLDEITINQDPWVKVFKLDSYCLHDVHSSESSLQRSKIHLSTSITLVSSYVMQ